MKVLDLFEIDTSVVDSSKIKLDESRIDPQFFSTNQLFLDKLDTRPLSYYCDEIFNPAVFKREFLEDPNECRYLASAEIASFEPEITYITNSQADALRLRVKKGWILITGFGTIGSIRITDKIIDDFAVANNVARAIVKEKYRGFIAAFLSSEYGNKLLNDYAAGAVVKYIEAPQIAKIPVPVLDDSIIEKINHLLLEAVTCREHSHVLLEKAHKLVLQYNNLPQLSDIKPETIDADGEVEIRMTGLDEFTQDYRLDAHFYNPLVKCMEEEIKNSTIKYARIGDLCNEIRMSPLFVRNFVDQEFGTKYIAGKHISQIRKSFKYISNTETEELEEHKLHKGWILMTCAGTIGKCGYVNDELDGATAQDLMRIIPNKEVINGDYLYAWLSTDYGKALAVRQKYGAVVDRISPEQTGEILIPLPTEIQQKEIGDLVRKAYELRAKAIKLEDEAQELLTQALTQA